MADGPYRLVTDPHDSVGENTRYIVDAVTGYTVIRCDDAKLRRWLLGRLAERDVLLGVVRKAEEAIEQLGGCDCVEDGLLAEIRAVLAKCGRGA